jgi:hypothetical protein
MGISTLLPCMARLFTAPKSLFSHVQGLFGNQKNIQKWGERERQGGISGAKTRVFEQSSGVGSIPPPWLVQFFPEAFLKGEKVGKYLWNADVHGFPPTIPD